jgi:hypothetical protein
VKAFFFEPECSVSFAFYLVLSWKLVAKLGKEVRLSHMLLVACLFDVGVEDLEEKDCGNARHHLFLFVFC